MPFTIRARQTQTFKIPGGSAAQPSLAFANASTSGLFHSGTQGNVGVSVNGAEKMTIHANGVSVNGTVTATAFVGDGSGLSNIDIATANYGMTLANVVVTDAIFATLDDTAVSTTGGYIAINGTGFWGGSLVTIGDTPALSTTVLSYTKIGAQVPAKAAGTYAVTVTRPDSYSASLPTGISYSPFPTWSTSSILANVSKTAVFSQTLAATEGSTITYVVSSGSSLPANVNLTSNGVLNGYIVDAPGSDTTYSFAIDAVDAQYQNIPRTFSLLATVSPRPVDVVSNVAGAYGLRLLTSAYTGPLLRIRRSSDNAESNIDAMSITNGIANANAITSFVGSGNGHVVSWYDQSGNARHLTQANVSLQPRIATLGTLITRQNTLSVYFDGTSYLQGVSNIDISGADPLFTHVGVHSVDSGFSNLATRSTVLSFGNVANSYTFQYETTPKVSAGFQVGIERANALVDFATSVMAVNTIRKTSVNGNGWTIRQNCAGKTFVPAADGVVNIANSSLVVGGFVDATNRYPSTMHMSELLVYPSALSDATLDAVESRMGFSLISKSTLYMATAAYYATVRNTAGWYDNTVEFASANMQSYGTTTAFDTVWSSGTYADGNVYAQVVDAVVYHTKNRSVGHTHTLNIVNATIVFSSDGLIHAEKVSSTQYKLWGLTEINNSTNTRTYTNALLKNYSEATALSVYADASGTPVVVNENPSLASAVVSTPATLYILGAEYAANASSQYDTMYAAPLAFDKITTTNGWLTVQSGAMPQWLSYAYPRAVVLTRYSVATNNAAASWGHPVAFQMQGSNDNSTFTAIDTRSGQTTWALNETKVFVVTSNSTAYRYYRLYITTSTISTTVSVGELRLYTNRA